MSGLEQHRKMKPSSYAIIEPEEATLLIMSNVRVLEAEETKLEEGLGRILAEDIYSTLDMPPFDATAVDGYALQSSDDLRQRRIIGEQTAGRITHQRVEPGTAIRIMTGAPMPEGADAVVMVEYTREKDGLLEVDSAPNPGNNIRPRSEDLQSGQLILKAGTLLGPAELGLLATTGLALIKLIRRPRLAVISTGDEIVEPGKLLAPGQIYDSNRFGLMAAVAQAYAEPFSLGIAPDTEAGLRNLIEVALRNYDGLITSGGVSVGKLDLMKDLLEELGTIHFGRVNLRPGKPLTFVTVAVEEQTKPIFALPGFPVASLVSFELFARPAILKMGGHIHVQRPRVQARLAHSLTHSRERNEFVRAVVTQEFEPSSGGSYYYTARTTGSQSSGRLLSMLGANALLHLAPGEKILEEGEVVPAILLTDVPIMKM
ncbi:MAG: gephyrin-like molybdotransferase Glp [Chloroflexota bacterium]|nr:molybdopterin molybdotransferase MoeA [Chloroflexota bacterium]